MNELKIFNNIILFKDSSKFHTCLHFRVYACEILLQLYSGILPFLGCLGWNRVIDTKILESCLGYLEHLESPLPASVSKTERGFSLQAWEHCLQVFIQSLHCVSILPLEGADDIDLDRSVASKRLGLLELSFLQSGRNCKDPISCYLRVNNCIWEYYNYMPVC